MIASDNRKMTSSGSLTVPKRSSRSGYSKSGCLSCKRRKKKCDERHPVCTACERNNLCCAWQTPATDSDAPGAASRVFMNTKIYGLSALILDEKSAKFFDHFINHFIPVITAPHASPKCHPLVLTVPQIYTNPVVSDLALACGAMDLSWTSPGAREIADSYYTRCIRRLREAIKNKTAVPDDDWLFTAMQFLALYEKFYGGPASRCLAHLSGAFYLVMERFKECLVAKDMQVIRPQDKMLLESFLFNTSMAVLFTADEDLYKLPSPALFDALLALLHKPIDNRASESELPWQENPIMGCAVDLYAYVTHISWFSRRREESNVDVRQALVWLEGLERWNSPMITAADRKRPDFQTIQMHYTASRILKQSLLILLLKTLYPDKPESDPEFIRHLDIALHELENIPERTLSNCMLPWPLAILGFIAVKPTHRSIIKKRMSHIGELMHAAFAKNLSLLFDEVWAPGGPGFDIIYDRPRMVFAAP